MKRSVTCIPVILLWIALTLSAWLLPAEAESDAERRPLAQMPRITVKHLLSGSFMDTFEDYTLDQFPLRDTFRSLKARFHTDVLGNRDSNGIYLHEGYAAKMEYPLNESSVKHAMDRFAYLREKYLTDSKVYLAVVPDKNYYLAQESGRLTMDYDRLYTMIQENMPWAEQIDLRDCLTLSDYYRTDTHWRQEKLLPVAERISKALGVTVTKAEEYTPTTLDVPFYGVYYGQAALPMEADALTVLENDLLNGCSVYDHETGKSFSVYDMEKQNSRDRYDVFLGGAKALLTIENPMGDPRKELIVFRDSFGSSLIPLLLQEYGRVTVIDIRYVGIDLLDRFVEFRGQDVLMLYSTLILNNSSAIK